MFYEQKVFVDLRVRLVTSGGVPGTRSSTPGVLRSSSFVGVVVEYGVGVLRSTPSTYYGAPCYDLTSGVCYDQVTCFIGASFPVRYVQNT